MPTANTGGKENVAVCGAQKGWGFDVEEIAIDEHPKIDYTRVSDQAPTTALGRVSKKVGLSAVPEVPTCQSLSLCLLEDMGKKDLDEEAAVESQPLLLRATIEEKW